jgi:predicted dehydrogenase
VIHFGVIGYGYWGPNLVRNIAEIAEAELLWLSDLRDERLALAKRRFPYISTTTNYREILQDSRVDVVVIATPVHTHFRLAIEALKAGKHVILEKPMTASSEEAERLIETAAESNLQIMVDHTFIYTGAVRKIKSLISDGSLGAIQHYHSVRINLGLLQPDVSVLWDLAVHDLSIMDYVLPAKPVAVSATGFSNFPDRPENIAYMTLFFNEPLIAHVFVSWLSPQKIRTTHIGATKKMLVYDDNLPVEKVKIFDSGVDFTQDQIDSPHAHIAYRVGDVLSPALDPAEPLGAEFRYYVHCLETGEKPPSDGRSGLQVVRILEAATKSIKERGRLVELGPSLHR